ncbi:hypothetical protein VQH23_03975 [Pararoseomonas sp. SCSIO 73927]|uniref:hypothetical protein n=1 Tax=Pararoseomonas sp. SCSIO 73927 TaxID=3114537 RepID=UPI0030CB2334
MDEANRDRLDKAAADWAGRMLFSEPLKVIAAAQSRSEPAVAWLLVAVMASQLLGYLYLGWRVGRHGGYPNLHHGPEWVRGAAVLAYVAYIGGFVWVFCLPP